MEKLSVTHSCGQSALKCVDCSEQVCPKCFVQCAVGNRCKKCAGRFTSHILKAPPKVLIRLGLAMAVLGVGYGYLARSMSDMPLGFYSYIVEFFIFMAVGKLMHRIASYKQGVKVVGTAVLALLVGLACSPLRDVFISALTSPGAGGGDYVFSQYLVHLAIFSVGVLFPFLRKG